MMGFTWNSTIRSFACRGDSFGSNTKSRCLHTMESRDSIPGRYLLSGLWSTRHNKIPREKNFFLASDLSVVLAWDSNALNGVPASATENLGRNCLGCWLHEDVVNIS